MFNVLLEHFVVSPEILCLKQRMFFVLFGGVCFLFEKICNVIVDCRSFYRNCISKFSTKSFSFKHGKRRTIRNCKKLSVLMVKNGLLADSYKNSSESKC